MNQSQTASTDADDEALLKNLAEKLGWNTFQNALPELDEYFRKRRYKNEVAPNHTTAFIALVRYAVLLRHGLVQLAGVLKEADLLLLLDANPGGIIDVDTSGSLITRIFEQNGWEKWDDITPDYRQLIEALQKLDFTTELTLVDCVERMWNCKRSTEQYVSWKERADAVGLVLRG